MSADEKKCKLVSRLKRIEGQLRAVRGMIEDKRDCGEVFQQMLAASGAMKSTLTVMIKGDLCNCMQKVKEDGTIDQDELEKILNAISKVL